MSKLLYKYLDFSEGSLRVISQGTIKFSRPAEFNDPFDCSPEFDGEKHLEYLANNPNMLRQARDRLDVTPAGLLSEKTKIINRLQRAFKTGDFNSQIISNLGICCLSRSALNLLMWAHYAKNHTGFIVEFKIPERAYVKESELNKYILECLIPAEVQYESNKPVIDPSDDKDTNMRKNFLTKGKDWEYENEERVIDYIRGPGIHTYDRSKILNSVIAGMRISDKNYSELQERVKTLNEEIGTSVQLYKAEPKPREYGLLVRGRSDIQT